MSKEGKVNKKSIDIRKNEIKKLKNIFPSVVQEGEVDFEKLKAILGKENISNEKSYGLSWAGKENVFKVIQKQSKTRLKPNKSESINFKKSDNIFVEGENLETLKLLQKSYMDKIKMIYIDPPYNTGDDFIYEDDYTNGMQKYLEQTGQIDEEGNHLTTNKETSGRYHSDWLNMMYPRVFLARQLLKEDGVIFVSIDDNEDHNLQLIMNEIFGEENFVSKLVWRKKRGYGRGNSLFIYQTEYILCYAKNVEKIDEFKKPLSEHKLKDYKYDDSLGKYKRETLEHHSPTGAYERPTLQYPLEIEGKEIYCTTGQWLWSQERVEEELEDVIGYDENGNKEYRYLDIVKDSKGRWRAYKKIRLRNEDGEMRGETPLTLIDESDITTNASAKEIKDIFGAKVYDYAKPTKLIKFLLSFSTSSQDEDIVLDFFAGTCTTAQAVLEKNKEDDGNRKFITVQLPEPVPEDHPARDEGYNDIAEIGKERIRRVINGFPEDQEPKNEGFKVFELDKTVFRKWQAPQNGDTEELKEQLKLFKHKIDEDVEDEEIIFEILIKQGFSLNSKIEQLNNINSNEIYKIKNIISDNEDELFLCLDENIEDDTLQKLNLTNEETFICFDSSLNDEQKLNLSMQVHLEVI